MDIIEREEPDLDKKLTLPVFWGKIAGLTVQELQADMFDGCLKLIERYLIPEEAMCYALDMKSDSVSCANLLANARDCIRDGTSIVVFKGEDYVEEVKEEEGQENGEMGELGVEMEDEVEGQGVLEKNTEGNDRWVEIEQVEDNVTEDNTTTVEDLATELNSNELDNGTEETMMKEKETIQHVPEVGECGEEEQTEDMPKREKRKKRNKDKKEKKRNKREKEMQESDVEDERTNVKWEDAEKVDEIPTTAEPGDEVTIKDEDDPRIVAVMVARVVQRLEHMRSFSRIKVVQSDRYQKWLALRCHLQKTANLFEEYDIDNYYRLYHIVVHPDHRKKGVARFLVRLAAERLTEVFAGPGAVCTAVAPSRNAQRLLARAGFRPRTILNYHEWKDEQGQQVIGNAGIGNYNVVLAVYQVPDREEGDSPDISPLSDPAEESFEPEPELPSAFPARDRGLERPPPPRCPPALDRPPFLVLASRPPSAQLQRGEGQGAARARRHSGQLPQLRA